jgi:hypothetical protein
MMKLIVAAACAVALSASGAVAGFKDKDMTKTQAQPGTTTGAAGNQKLYGGNPDAGGGPRGSTQSTNSPNASKEIGGGR